MDCNEKLKTQFNELKDPYERVVGHVRKLYNNDISEQEAHEAARNLIGYCKLLLEIHRQRIQNQRQEQCHDRV